MNTIGKLFIGLIILAFAINECNAQTFNFECYVEDYIGTLHMSDIEINLDGLAFQNYTDSSTSTFNSNLFLPENLRVKLYYIDGNYQWNEDIEYSELRNLSFSDLPYGNYRISVWGLDNDSTGRKFRNNISINEAQYEFTLAVDQLHLNNTFYFESNSALITVFSDDLTGVKFSYTLSGHCGKTTTSLGSLFYDSSLNLYYGFTGGIGSLSALAYIGLNDCITTSMYAYGDEIETNAPVGVDVPGNYDWISPMYYIGTKHAHYTYEYTWEYVYPSLESQGWNKDELILTNY